MRGKRKSNGALPSQDQQFRGSRIIPTGLPVEYRNHRWVQGQAFFTLPRPLLDALRPILQTPELWELELALSDICGDHTQRVGFWQDSPISYSHVRRTAINATGFLNGVDPRSLGWDVRLPQIEHVLKVAEKRVGPFALVAKGYLGWLMLNQAFLDEQDQLFQTWHQEIQEWGPQQLGRATSGNIPAELKTTPTRRIAAFSEAFEQLFLRWRLAGMAARNLPVPLTPQAPVSAPILAMGPINKVGALVYLPDTFPIPSRDELRGILEDALRGSCGPSHLAGWAQIVRGNNPAKNQIIRYARLFELQHYYRILNQRHGETLKGKVGKLQTALASFLKCSEDTIQRELGFIRRRQGPLVQGGLRPIGRSPGADVPGGQRRARSSR